MPGGHPLGDVSDIVRHVLVGEEHNQFARLAGHARLRLAHHADEGLGQFILKINGLTIILGPDMHQGLAVKGKIYAAAHSPPSAASDTPSLSDKHITGVSIEISNRRRCGYQALAGCQQPLVMTRYGANRMV
jgi:hypothetical protein